MERLLQTARPKPTAWLWLVPLLATLLVGSAFPAAAHERYHSGYHHHHHYGWRGELFIPPPAIYTPPPSYYYAPPPPVYYAPSVGGLTTGPLLPLPWFGPSVRVR
ncbi:MAG: hypothetical protein WCF85_12585 [Rhodospirillaceae bacterium]